MYLKSIEVHGFKSFANKLRFDFRDGITAIVGPNGSGKSNVVDAVRWVFGEQSAKQLRGGNMQDVIFAGTENRRPQSYAEVSIVLDNSDKALDIAFEEVKITRRLYRSGESEYLINDRAARLKDINELFYDTGIGKEGYSVIGQNQIEKILSGKMEDRRELFDEAVGIVKFKRRKNAAVKKLESEQQNLLRVGDILNELTNQLGPLRRQSETARIYLNKKETLKSLDINLYLLDAEAAEMRLRELADKNRLVTEELADKRNAFEEARREYVELEKAIEEVDARITAVRENSSRCALKKQELKGRIALLKEQIRTVKTNDEHYDNRRAQIGAEIDRRRRELASRAGEEDNLTVVLREMTAEADSEKASLSELEAALADQNRELEQLQAALIDLLNKRVTIKGRAQRCDAMMEQIDIRRAELVRRSLRFTEEETEASRSLEDNAKDKTLVEAEIASLTEECRACEKEAAKAQSSLTTLMSRLEESQTAYHRTSSRLDSLRSMEEQYDGYGNGIRYVMDEKPNEPGIVGVVAELISVSKTYEVAIETALGAKARNIVTDDEGTVKRMIALLKKNRLGRATFLPMTNIRDVKPFEMKAALREPGVIGLGSSLVNITVPGYEILSEYLLGRTLVVDTIDNAMKIGAKYRHGLYMVTLQGELFTPGGAITGGAFKNSVNLLGRHREIEELQEKTGTLKKDIAALQSQVNETRQRRNDLRESILKLNEQLQKAKIRQNTIEIQRRQAEERLNDNKLSHEGLNDENKEIAGQIAQVKESRESLDAELARSLEEEASLKTRAETLQREIEDSQKKRDAQAAVLEKCHVRLASLEQQAANMADNRKRLLAEIGAFEAEEETLIRNREGSAAEITQRTRGIEEAENDIRQAEREAEEAGEAERSLIEEKQELAVRHKKFFDSREALGDAINRLDKENYRLNTQIENLEEEREKQTAYMWEEYELTPSEARALRREDLSERSALKKEVSRIKDEIKALGSVNVNAIEEYREVSERHDFLKTQHDDLIKSEETLTQIIRELDDGMRRQFHEQFGRINREFDKVAKELFGGGMGSLRLKDDSDVLETDVEINVQPPGKKLQTIQLLSGGERALTAIALLFAIQNLKPSPFCILDEIEAALDENNTTRFAQYLRKLTKNTQFIVITHRRGTMVSADRLYGITMMEKGVSTLVSVSLIENSLDK